MSNFYQRSIRPHLKAVKARLSSRQPQPLEVERTFDPDEHDNRHMIEVRQTLDRGQAIYANRNIPRGTVILSETALIYLDPDRKYSTDDEMESAVQAAYDELPSDKMKICYTLYKPNNRTAGIVMGIYPIYKVNAYGTALLEIASRFNHSCIPSVQMIETDREGSKYFEWVTLRDVPANEEITKGYLGVPPFMTRGARQQEIWTTWQFHCQCPACKFTIAGCKLEKLFIDMAAVGRLSEKGNLATKTEEFRTTEFHKQHLLAVEKQANQLVSLGLRGTELRALYRSATISCVCLADLESAVKWARKAVTISVFEGSRSRSCQKDMKIVRELETIKWKVLEGATIPQRLARYAQMAS